jgi:hypothetical protein
MPPHQRVHGNHQADPAPAVKVETNLFQQPHIVVDCVVRFELELLAVTGGDPVRVPVATSVSTALDPKELRIVMAEVNQIIQEQDEPEVHASRDRQHAVPPDTIPSWMDDQEPPV